MGWGVAWPNRAAKQRPRARSARPPPRPGATRPHPSPQSEWRSQSSVKLLGAAQPPGRMHLGFVCAYTGAARGRVDLRPASAMTAGHGPWADSAGAAPRPAGCRPDLGAGRSGTARRPMGGRSPRDGRSLRRGSVLRSDTRCWRGCWRPPMAERVTCSGQEWTESGYSNTGMPSSGVLPCGVTLISAVS